jgi:hypothetical protein
MKFSELDEAAKAYAVEKYNDTNDSWWSDSVIEMAQEDGKELGFDIDKVYFSGFWSQGDGASWVGRIDVVKWCTNQMEADPKYRVLRAMAEVGMIETRTCISQSGHYYHQYTMGIDTIEVINDDEAKYDGELEPLFVGCTLLELFGSIGGHDALTDMEKDMLESARDYAAKIYTNLEEEYDYLSSEEAFAETAEANEWSFDETGEME